jgi:hypothetical protein
MKIELNTQGSCIEHDNLDLSLWVRHEDQFEGNIYMAVKDGWAGKYTLKNLTTGGCWKSHCSEDDLVDIFKFKDPDGSYFKRIMKPLVTITEWAGE